MNGPRTAVVVRLVLWLAIPAAAVLSLVAASAVGLALLSIADTFCAPGARMSGVCTAPWYDVIAAGISCFSTALAASLMVGSTWGIAPSGKGAAAACILLLGIVFAVYSALATGAWAAACSAVLGGGTTYWLLTARVRPPSGPHP